jgi:cation diffusion facilitator family transporter
LTARRPGGGAFGDDQGVVDDRNPPDSDAASQQRGAVITALVANVVVALAKLVAWLVSGSSALLAEALHSAADSGNEVLLLVGVRRSTRPADARHPFGHARYRYLYAFVVSLTIFWIGGVLAVIEGVVHLANAEPLADPRLGFVVLGLGAVLDGWSLRTTVRAGRTSKGSQSWKSLVRSTKVPDLIVVLLEDFGAIIGIAIATIGLGLASLTGQVVWDAIASVAIGILLMAIGLVVNRETQSLLLGESATVPMEAAIRRSIETTPGIAGVTDLRTIHLGPDDLVVAGRILFAPVSDATSIDRAIATAEAAIVASVEIRTVTVYLEPRLVPAEAPSPPGVASPD